MQTATIPVPTVPKRPPASAWSTDAIMALYELPFMDLMHRAQQTHRAHFDPNVIQLSTPGRGIAVDRLGGPTQTAAPCAFAPSENRHACRPPP
jgi:hypothetical protein